MLTLFLAVKVQIIDKNCKGDDDDIICTGTTIPEHPELYNEWRNDECKFKEMKTPLHEIVCNTIKPVSVTDDYFFVKIQHDEDEREKCRVYKGEDYIYCPEFENPFYSQEYNITNGEKYYKATTDWQHRETVEKHNFWEIFFKGQFPPSKLGPEHINRIDYDDAKAIYSLVDLDKKTGLENIEIIEAEEKGELIEDYSEEPSYAPEEKIYFPGVDLEEVAELTVALTEVMKIFGVDAKKISKVFSNPNAKWADLYDALGVKIPKTYKILTAFNNLVHHEKKLIPSLNEFGFKGELYESLIKSVQKLVSTKEIESQNFVDTLSKISPAFDDYVSTLIQVAPPCLKEVFIEAYKLFDLGEMNVTIHTLVEKLKKVPEVGDEIKDFIEDMEEFGLDFDKIVKENTTSKTVFNALWLVFNSSTSIIDVISYVKPEIGQMLTAIANGETLKTVIGNYNQHYYDVVKSVLMDIADETKAINENPHLAKHINKHLQKLIDFSYDVINDQFDQAKITKHAELIKDIGEKPIINVLNKYLYESTYEGTLADLSVFLDIVIFHIERIDKKLPAIKILEPVKKFNEFSIEKMKAASNLMKTNKVFTAAEFLSTVFPDKIMWNKIPALLLEEKANLIGVLDVLTEGNTFINVKETVTKLAAIKPAPAVRRAAAADTPVSFAQLSNSVVVPETSKFTFNDVVPMKSVYKVTSENKEAIAADTFNAKQAGDAIGFDIVEAAKELSDVKTTKVIADATNPEIVKSVSKIVDSAKNGRIDLNVLTDSFNALAYEIEPDLFLFGLSKGAIVGIVIGVLAIVALIVGIVVFTMHKKKLNGNNKELEKQLAEPRYN